MKDERLCDRQALASAGGLIGGTGLTTDARSVGRLRQMKARADWWIARVVRGREMISKVQWQNDLVEGRRRMRVEGGLLV